MRNYIFAILLSILPTITFSQVFGFEDGTSNDWSDYRAQTLGSPEASIIGLQANGTGVIQVTSAGNDAFLNSLGVNISSVSPSGGAHSLLMEDYQVGGRVTQVTRTFPVTQQTALYVYHYAVMLEDPGHAGRPFFKVEVTDQNGNLVPCGEYVVIADNPANDGFSAVAGQGVGGATTYWYKDWTYVAVNLETYIGQNITVTYTVGDCSAGEHMAYAYIDETVSPLEATVVNYCPGDPTVTLEAPDGFLSYLWWTPSPVFNQTAVIANPGSIDSVWVEMESELGSCPITMTVHLNNLPVAYPYFDYTEVCAGTDVDFTNTTNTNGTTITNYLWDFGDGSATSSDENPSHNYSTPGTYSVNFQITTNSGCISDTTMDIIVDCCIPPTTFNYNVDACGSQVTFNYTGTADNTYIYNWNFQSGTVISGSGQGPIIVDFGAAGNYNISLEVTNNIGGISCDTTGNTQNITILESLNIDAEKTDIVCFGDANGTATAIVGSQSISSYQWNDNNNQNTQTATGLDVGTYTVIVTNTSGCTAMASVDILSLFPAIELNLIPVDILCNGLNTGSIIANVAGGAAPYSFEWNTGSTEQNLSALYAGNYTLTVKDLNKCTISKTVPISEPSELYVAVNTNFFVCKNTDNTLIATVSGGTLNGGNYSYLWNTSSVNSAINYNINTDTQYTITVSDANNCTATTQSNIFVYTDVDLTATASLDSVCPGDPIQINGSAIGGKPTITITVNGIVSNLPTIHYPNNNSSLTIVATDQCGSTDTEILNLNVFPVPTLAISSDLLNGCPPLTVNFNEGSNINGATYNWSFGVVDENNYTGTSNPTHIFDQSGTYDVSLELITKDGCRVQQTITDMITVFPQPEAMFEATPDAVSFIEPTVTFINYSTHNYNNYWYFGDGDMSSIANPIHDYSSIQDFEVMLVVESEYGCVDSVFSHISVKDEFTLYAPTAFSPDNDGINDGFRLVGHGIDTDNYTLMIYDRWGEKIWTSNNLFEEWKGTAKNGTQTVQNGTYKWLVVCKDFRGVEYTKSGNITVIR